MILRKQWGYLIGIIKIIGIIVRMKSHYNDITTELYYHIETTETTIIIAAIFPLK